jgi:hypothetical protein
LHFVAAEAEEEENSKIVETIETMEEDDVDGGETRRGG